MKNIFSKKLIFFFLGFCILITLPLVAILLSPSSSPPKQVVPKISNLPSPDQKVYEKQRVLINKDEEELGDDLSSYKTKTIVENQTQYLFSSQQASRDDQVITEDKKVVFERKVTEPIDNNYPDINEYVLIFGQPERIFEGSYHYGDFEKTYVWASKGIALQVASLSGLVDEIQTFTPTSVEDYLQRWGQDIYSEPNPIPDP